MYFNFSFQTLYQTFSYFFHNKSMTNMPKIWGITNSLRNVSKRFRCLCNNKNRHGVWKKKTATNDFNIWWEGKEMSLLWKLRTRKSRFFTTVLIRHSFCPHSFNSYFYLRSGAQFISAVKRTVQRIYALRSNLHSSVSFHNELASDLYTQTFISFFWRISNYNFTLYRITFSKYKFQ